jgi:hypothetical protein
VQLTAVRRRIERWRARWGGRGMRIPGRLWEEAVRLARREGVLATAQALGLDCGRLAARMKAAAAPGDSRGEEPPEFVEIGAAGWCTASRTEVRLASRDGDVVCLEVTGASAVDVAGVVQAFWDRRR